MNGSVRMLCPTLAVVVIFIATPSLAADDAPGRGVEQGLTVTSYEEATSSTQTFVQGRAKPGAVVTLSVNGKVSAKLTADAEGSFLFTGLALSDGKNTVKLETAPPDAQAVEFAVFGGKYTRFKTAGAVSLESGTNWATTDYAMAQAAFWGTPSSPTYTQASASMLVDGVISGDLRATLGYWSQPKSDASSQDSRFFGDDSTISWPAKSADGVYVRLAKDGFEAVHGDVDIRWADMSTLPYTRAVTGTSMSLVSPESASNRLELTAFIANPRTSSGSEAWPADGVTGVIHLANKKVTAGSEQVAVQVRDKDDPGQGLSTIALLRDIDYRIDYSEGIFTLLEPVPARDIEGNLNWVTITYSYTGDDAVYETRGAKLSASYGKRLSASAVFIDEGDITSSNYGTRTGLRLTATPTDWAALTFEKSFSGASADITFTNAKKGEEDAESGGSVRPYTAYASYALTQEDGLWGNRPTNPGSTVSTAKPQSGESVKVGYATTLTDGLRASVSAMRSSSKTNVGASLTRHSTPGMVGWSLGLAHVTSSDAKGDGSARTSASASVVPTVTGKVQPEFRAEVGHDGTDFDAEGGLRLSLDVPKDLRLVTDFTIDTSGQTRLALGLAKPKASTGPDLSASMAGDGSLSITLKDKWSLSETLSATASLSRADQSAKGGTASTSGSLGLEYRAKATSALEKAALRLGYSTTSSTQASAVSTGLTLAGSLGDAKWKASYASRPVLSGGTWGTPLGDYSMGVAYRPMWDSTTVALAFVEGGNRTDGTDSVKGSVDIAKQLGKATTLSLKWARKSVWPTDGQGQATAITTLSQLGFRQGLIGSLEGFGYLRLMDEATSRQTVTGWMAGVGLPIRSDWGELRLETGLRQWSLSQVDASGTAMPEELVSGAFLKLSVLF